MIDEYRFGSIVIDGEAYDHDVEVRWNGEVLKWWRDKGHVFQPQDIERAMNENPEIIILGTGAYGVSEVPQETKELVREENIKLIVDKTEEAIRTFNIIMEKAQEQHIEKKVIGLFHLTC